MGLPKKSGTNSGTSGFKLPSSLACSSFVLFTAIELFGSDSGGCIDGFIGIRKFLGVGGGGTHVSVADAIIGTRGTYTGCRPFGEMTFAFAAAAAALTGFVDALESEMW